MASEETWVDRWGDRAFEMLWETWYGSLGWAVVGGLVGAFIGLLPGTSLPFTTWLVAGAGIGFLAWWAVGMLLGCVAVLGMIGEASAALVGWLRRR